MNRIPTPPRSHSPRFVGPLLTLQLAVIARAAMLMSSWSGTGSDAGPRLGRRQRRTRRLHGSDGDVPGWVMVTLMSALLVAGIYAVAGPALINMFSNAIDKVGGLK